MGIALHHTTKAAVVLTIHAGIGLVNVIAVAKRHFSRPIATIAVNLTLYVFYGGKCYIFLQIITLIAPKIMEYH
tara:strand:- start:1048 stop:1269 length:222 start_codon:yes stop_codon:yes gene_type:complete